MVEIGPNEIKKLTVQIKQRTIESNINSKIMQLPKVIRDLGESLEKVIKDRSYEQFRSLNRIAKTKVDLLNFVKNEFLTKAPFCDESTCYEKISEVTGREIIGREYKESISRNSSCVICKKKSVQNLYFGIKWKGEK